MGITMSDSDKKPEPPKDPTPPTSRLITNSVRDKDKSNSKDED